MKDNCMINQGKSTYIFLSFLAFVFFNSVADESGQENAYVPKVAISALDCSRAIQFVDCEDGCNTLDIQKLNSLGIYPIYVKLYNQEMVPVMLSGQSFRFESFDYKNIAEYFYNHHQLTPFLGLESMAVGCLLHSLFPDLTKYLNPDETDPLVYSVAKYSNLVFGATGGFLYWLHAKQKNNLIDSYLKNISNFQSSGKQMILPPGEVIRFTLLLNRKEYMSPLIIYARDTQTQQEVQLCYIHLHINEKTLLYQKVDQMNAPQEVKEEMWEILDRLDRIPVESPESHIARTHLEWLMALPWGKMTEDMTDLVQAQAILDEDHAGLQDVKDTIVEFMAVRTFNHASAAPIICLVGPPGVGKTSLAKSIARCLNRTFATISLGGMHDEAEIRGHRRTYIGALPGRVIQAIKTAGSSNPVLLLDEIDKMGNHHSQAAEAALLEVLDPMQNKTFRDTYLGVPFDLSEVLFIATANTVDAIPDALRDRMLIIKLPGYTKEEKMTIARDYLVGRSLEYAGLKERNIQIDDTIIEGLIMGYTSEAGVRQLSRLLDTLCAKIARIILEENRSAVLEVDTLENYFGPKKKIDEIGKQNEVGMVNGLAWTAHGGTMTRIEVVLTPGKGKLKLTGHLGDVMRESAEAALTYVHAHAQELGIDEELFNKYTIHIHAPAGAVPKDGPSAGITILVALVSAFTQKKFDARYAMTGEIDLHGNVMPIGGLKEKLLAAKGFGITYAIAPRGNQPDIDGKEALFTDLNVIWVDRAEQVLKLVFNTIE
jgi:ATP-dependent Lon protease